MWFKPSQLDLTDDPNKVIQSSPVLQNYFECLRMRQSVLKSIRMQCAVFWMLQSCLECSRMLWVSNWNFVGPRCMWTKSAVLAEGHLTFVRRSELWSDPSCLVFWTGSQIERFCLLVTVHCWYSVACTCSYPQKTEIRTSNSAQPTTTMMGDVNELIFLQIK